jgi:hypothetical protein
MLITLNRGRSVKSDALAPRTGGSVRFPNGLTAI